MSDRRKHPHVPPEDLAQLAEGTLAEPDSRGLREHVATCRTCLAAYSEAVRLRAAWLATPEAFEAPTGWEEAGLEVLRRSQGWSTSPRLARLPRPRRFGLVWAWVATAASLVVIAWLGPSLQRRPTTVLLPPGIRSAVEQASSRGLVLPGGEASANARLPQYRAVGAAELREAVTRGLLRYERDRGSSEALYAASVGLLVTGQLAAARDYLREGLELHPRDPNLRLLTADLAYRESRLDEAERHLRAALRSHPRDPLATLDLGIVLAEAGRRREARRVLQSVADRDRGPLGARARSELARF